MSEKKLEIVFAPGCFDSFDGTQEELQELLAEIRQMAENGTLLENSEPLPAEEEEKMWEMIEEKQKERKQ